MKKLVSFAVAVLLLLGSAVLTSCVENPPADTGSDVTTQNVQTEPPTETERLHVDPMNVDFGGETITFLVTRESAGNKDWYCKDVFVEAESADPIETAVYRRNKIVEEQLNCKIAQELVDDVSGTAAKSIKSGADDFQVLMANTQGTLTLASNHQIVDLNTTSIDLKNPWWDQNMRVNCSIGGRNYFATGDISIMDNDATWVLMFNKSMISKYDLESPYSLVEKNEWTYDKMYEMMLKVSSGISSDGKPDYKTDTFGWATHDSARDALYYAAGLKVVAKDETDAPYYPVQNTEYIVAVLEKSIEMWTDKSVTTSCTRENYSYDELQEIFQSGRALFFGEVMQLVIRLREMDIDFGLIPYPKFSADQQNYGHFVHSVSELLSIPTTCKKLSEVSYFIECLACESLYTLTPAYYEVTLKNKLLRDPESDEMLDIILASRTFDLGSSFMFNWGTLGSVFPTLLGQGKTTYVSEYNKKIKNAEKMMNKAILKLLSD